MRLFSDDAKYAMLESIDDKAYVRPGTSEGFENARKKKIMTTYDTARHLPKYDWPEKMVYQTPAAHRIMEKEVVEVDGKPTLSTSSDHHIVITRPKAYVDSGGSTWASESVRLRADMPNVFEVPGSGRQVDTEVRSYCARLHDAVFLYKDMTMEDDYTKVTVRAECQYRSYEELRTNKLLSELETATDTVEMTDGLSAIGKVLMDTVKASAKTLESKIHSLQHCCRHGQDCTAIFEDVDAACSDVLAVIADANLPKVKPRKVTCADAGPGVGINNNDVRFRDAECARKDNMDYSIRVHRSRDDSGQNEAERTNSASGDAIVDGGTIHWEILKRFEGLSEEEISSLLLDEFEQLEKE